MIAILGAGESGVGAAILAQVCGFEVWVSDFGKISERYKAELLALGIPFEEGGHDFERILGAELAIKSPGIPDKAPIIKALKAADIEIIDEIEFAFQQLKIKKPSAQIVAITGSNGKTTTTSLIYHLFKTAGLNVAVGGNIGQSFAKQVAQGEHDVYVLEVSSFQLDYCRTFQPNVAILLNITPDHLDRYEYKMANYVASKFRIVQNAAATDYFIFNAENEAIIAELPHKNIIAETFAVRSTHYIGKILKVADSRIAVEDLTIKGLHNAFNAVCAIAAAKRLGIGESEILQGLQTFCAVPHRLETVGKYREITFINDSKATNVDAAKYALLAMERPVIWIAGGTDKGNDYDELLPIVREKVKALVCLGLDNTKLAAAFGWLFREERVAHSAEAAAQIALQLAAPNDVILLSPACASFDLFKNYEHRGDAFREAVEKIAKK